MVSYIFYNESLGLEVLIHNFLYILYASVGSYYVNLQEKRKDYMFNS